MKKKLFTLSLLFASMLAILTSCERNEPEPPSESESEVKEVEIVEVINIGVESATFNGVINKDLSDCDNYEFGVYISESDNYIGDYIEWGDISEHLYKADVLINGRFTVDVEGLDANTEYRYSAYLIVNNDLYIFENDGRGIFKKFTTLDSSQSNANGHNYVDLGLPSGIKWAICNLGAGKPEEVGGYYAWGELWDKTYFTFDNYAFINNGSVDFTGINKYTIPDNNFDGIWYDKEGNFIGDNKDVLRYEDDAARDMLGGDWRIPRYEDFSELFDENNTTSANVTYNGVKGLQITSKKNGNSIFLPYTGVGVEYEVISQDIVCKYWTNNLSDKYWGSSSIEGTQYADSWTYIEGDTYGFSEKTLRYSGLPIRPVLP